MQVTVHSNDKIGTISPLLYGHFAEHIGGVIYGGLWVGKDSRIPNINGLRLDIVEKLKRISPSVIRWPGGCFAETYDWRDGIGTDRPIRPSWWTRQDGLYENNAFGTHEFMEFCALVGAEPYLAINATSLTPMDARNWVDYCNSPAGTTVNILSPENPFADNDFETPDRVYPAEKKCDLSGSVCLPKGAVMAISVSQKRKERREPDADHC